MLDLTHAAVDGQVVVKEDWLSRQVTITTRSGEIWNCRVTGLLGSLLQQVNHPLHDALLGIGRPAEI